MLELAHSSIRFTIGRYTNKEDVDHAVELVREKVEKLRDLSPLWDMYKEGVESGKLVLKKASASGSAKLLSEFDISSGRGSGYPKLALVDDHVFVAWTEPGEGGGIRSKWIQLGS